LRFQVLGKAITHPAENPLKVRFAEGTANPGSHPGAGCSESWRETVWGRATRPKCSLLLNQAGRKVRSAFEGLLTGTGYVCGAKIDPGRRGPHGGARTERARVTSAVAEGPWSEKRDSLTCTRLFGTGSKEDAGEEERPEAKGNRERKKDVTARSFGPQLDANIRVGVRTVWR